MREYRFPFYTYSCCHDCCRLKVDKAAAPSSVRRSSSSTGQNNRWLTIINATHRSINLEWTTYYLARASFGHSWNATGSLFPFSLRHASCIAFFYLSLLSMFPSASLRLWLQPIALLLCSDNIFISISARQQLLHHGSSKINSRSLQRN